MYWLVSLPGAKDETWRTLETATGKGQLSDNYRFELPMSLRVGSLDALMVLSDDLARVNITVEGVVNKIRRQASDFAPDEVLQVNNRPVASFLTSFSWDEARYPLRKPLKEIVEELTESVVGVDDDLKAKTAEFQTLKQAYHAANRKIGGSLAVKDVNQIVSKEDVVSTENLTSTIVTVPAYYVAEFHKAYESWCDMVVPRSAKTIAEDGDYALVRVILFRRVLDDFKQAARLKGCQCRDVEVEEEKEDSKEEEAGPSAAEEVARLERMMSEKRRELAAWCRTSYGEAFSAWVHICAVRLFVESVLRYGLPPQFLGTIIRPHGKHERVRKVLAETFGVHGADFWTDDGAGGRDEGKELHPYVSFTLDLDT